MCQWIGDFEALFEQAKAGVVEAYNSVVEEAFLAITRCTWAEVSVPPDVLSVVATDAAYRFAKVVRRGRLILFPNQYLCKILERQVGTYFAKLSRERSKMSALELDLPAPAVDVGEKMANKEILGRAFSAIGNGPDSKCLLWYLAGIPDAEIAERLGISEFTVRQKRRRLRLELREDIELAAADCEILACKRPTKGRNRKFVRRGRAINQEINDNQDPGAGSLS